jgi:hypothetical protein
VKNVRKELVDMIFFFEFLTKKKGEKEGGERRD